MRFASDAQAVLVAWAHEAVEPPVVALAWT
jgi:hypothetical protein